MTRNAAQPHFKHHRAHRLRMPHPKGGAPLPKSVMMEWMPTT